MESSMELTATTPELRESSGGVLWERYKEAEDDGDLNNAISMYEESVNLTSKFAPERASRLFKLGEALFVRFSNTREAPDIERACSCFEDSLLAQPAGLTGPSVLGYFEPAFMGLYSCAGDAGVIDRAVNILQAAADADPNDLPVLQTLSQMTHTKFELFRKTSDLDMWIATLQRQMDMTSDADHNKPSQLEELSKALVSRVQLTGNNGSDLDASIAAQWMAVDFTDDEDGDKPARLTSLGNLLQLRFTNYTDTSDIEASIVAQQRAIDLTPDEDPQKIERLSSLGNTFQTRYLHFALEEDLAASIAAEERAVELTPDGDPKKAERLRNLTTAHYARFCNLKDGSDLDAAIAIERKALDLIKDGDPSKPACISDIGLYLSQRFYLLHDPSDLDAAIAVQQAAVDLTPDEDPNKPRRLQNLSASLESRFNRFRSDSDRQQSVAAIQRAAEQTPNGHPDRAKYFSRVSSASLSRFEDSKDISDLDASIAAAQKAVDMTPDGDYEKPTYLTELGHTLRLRFYRNKDDSDLKAALDNLSAAAQSAIGTPITKLGAANIWVELCQRSGDVQATLRAFGCAIALVHQVAWMGFDMETQLEQLKSLQSWVGRAGVFAVQNGEPDLPIEWLEQGRSVIWNQILQLRSPFDLLRERDPVRADRLAAISQALENREAVIHTAIGFLDVESLVNERDKLLGEIRQLDGFGDFLGPKKAAELLRAAANGPVVVLNVDEFGCDALILTSGATTVKHLSLNFSAWTAQPLVDKLMDVVGLRQPKEGVVKREDRGSAFDIVAHPPSETDKMFRDLLEQLWTSVVKPVLDELGLSVRQGGGYLPRVWWCPTGPLAFLPIHAAGIYDINTPGPKISDFVVSSYTPTISALLRAQGPMTNHPNILAVAQTSSLANARREIDLLRHSATINEIDLVVAHDKEGTVHHVLQEMADYHWVHFACHASQDLIHPTKSGFTLADGCLEVAEIIKHPLPLAEFAFLSACQTAAGDVKLTQEAVHLAGGMMLAGYRSVIATMWSMQDKDGPIISDRVYAKILKDGEADASRAALALHDATEYLRSSDQPFLAWVPFIHIGA